MRNGRILLPIIAVVIVVAAVVAAVLLAHKNSNTNSANTSNTMSTMNMHSQAVGKTSDAVATDKVTIQNFAFSPAAVKVKVGTTVTWTNQDTTEHSVVGDESGSNEPNGPLLAKGKSYSFTFTKAGTFAYHCGVHPSMHGTVVVTE